MRDRFGGTIGTPSERVGQPLIPPLLAFWTLIAAKSEPTDSVTILCSPPKSVDLLHMPRYFSDFTSKDLADCGPTLL